MSEDKTAKGDKIAYQDKNISFMMENESVYVGNIVYERFRRSIPMHAHSDNSYEIHYISSGRGKVTVRDIDYDTGAGTLYITGPHVKHSMVPDADDPLEEYCIYLKLGSCGRGSRGGGSPLSVFRKMDVWYGKDRYGLGTLMKTLFGELRDQNIGYRSVVESVIRQIIVACVRNGSVDVNEAELPDFRSGNEQYLAIEEAFLYEYSTITLTALAKRLNLSCRQTQRLLGEHYDMNFQSKKTEAKMNAASLMLRSSGMSISQIAEELGYSSVEHFSSAFKKYQGESASAYRKNHLTAGGGRNEKL